MSSPLSDFQKRDAALQNSTSVDINDVCDVCLCFGSFKNQSEKRVKIRFNFEITDTTLNKAQTKTLIQALQKLVKEL
jgi:phenylalanyl-tRNA synthetase beta subunit